MKESFVGPRCCLAWLSGFFSNFAIFFAAENHVGLVLLFAAIAIIAGHLSFSEPPQEEPETPPCNKP